MLDHLKRAIWVLISSGLLASAVFAEPLDPEKVLVFERDALIAKIFQGRDVVGSVRAFQLLLERHQRLIATANEAKEASKGRQAELLIYRNSLDYEASWYCRLSVDPQQPQSGSHRPADWGRVVRKTEVALGKNDNVLSEDKAVTIYEIVGMRERYFVGADDEDPKFKAEVGDLVFLCSYSQKTHNELTPPWNTVTLTSPKYSGRIAELPRIVSKAKWNPIHIADQELRDAIMWKKWETPAGRYVLCLLRVERDLGNGSFAMLSHYWEDSFVLEVSPTLPRRELLKPGEFVWVIMGSPRLDKERQKLVLVAADLELRYLIER